MTELQAAFSGLVLEVSELTVSDVLPDAAAGADDDGAVVVSVLVVAVLVLSVVAAFVFAADASGAAGAAQIRVTRLPAFTNPRRVTALPSTGRVAEAGVFPAASVASPSVLSRTVIVLPAASTATTSAWT